MAKNAVIPVQGQTRAVALLDLEALESALTHLGQQHPSTVLPAAHAPVTSVFSPEEAEVRGIPVPKPGEVAVTEAAVDPDTTEPRPEAFLIRENNGAHRLEVFVRVGNAHWSGTLLYHVVLAKVKAAAREVAR